MSSTRKIAFSLGVLLVLAVIILALAAGIQLFLPQYLESTLLPRLLTEAGISEHTFNVRRIGVYGADLGEVRLGPPGKPSLHIRSVQLDYTPNGLYRKKIDRVVLAGVEIYAQFENGRFTFNNLDPQEVLARLQSRKSARAEPGQAPLPVQVNRLEIRNAAAVLRIYDQLYRIPFEVDIGSQDSGDSPVEVNARLYPREQRIACRSKIDLTRRRLSFDTEIVGLDLNRFSDIFPAWTPPSSSETSRLYSLSAIFLFFPKNCTTFYSPSSLRFHHFQVMIICSNTAPWAPFVTRITTSIMRLSPFLT